MRSFNHFTLEEREMLFKMTTENKTQCEMARRLGKSQSSISRELRRLERCDIDYTPSTAHAHYVFSRMNSVRHKRLENREVLADVISKLRKKWSPEIISNTQSKEIRVSTSTIYRSLKRNDIPGLNEANCLRRKGKRKYCYGGGKTIQAGRSIHLRETEANERTRIGDWEGDTVLGAIGKGLLVTLIDRKSRFLLMKRALNKTAKCVRETIVSLVKSKPCKTITLDNGSEFAEYDQLETESKATVYFADTHSPWQRGSNENINELIRWYFPKGTDFTMVSDECVASACREINQRPRKVLNWNTPEDVFNLCI